MVFEAEFARARRLYSISIHRPNKKPFPCNPINAGEVKECGKSNGDCYGYQMSMADSDLSPYKNNGQSLKYNKAIYKYQNNQSNREQDQRYIKRTRLTMKNFICSV